MIVNKLPKISIVTICFNSEAEIERTLKSVKEQTYQNIEYVIIDGNSKDNTLQLVNKYLDKNDVVISEDDEGIYDAMNKGIKNSSGDIVTFLNAGDEYLSKYSIDYVVNSIRSSNSEMFFANYLFVNEEQNFVKVCDVDLISDRADFLKYTFGHPSTYYKKDLFGKIGYFDSNNRIVSDVEWYLNAIINYKVTFSHINFVTSVFFDGGVSSSSNVIHEMERKRMIDKFFRQYEINIFSGRIFNILKSKILFKKIFSIIFRLKISKK